MLGTQEVWETSRGSALSSYKGLQKAGPIQGVQKVPDCTDIIAWFSLPHILPCLVPPGQQECQHHGLSWDSWKENF